MLDKDKTYIGAAKLVYPITQQCNVNMDNDTVNEMMSKHIASCKANKPCNINIKQ